MHLHFIDKTGLAVIRPAGVHFLLSFAVLSDIVVAVSCVMNNHWLYLLMRLALGSECPHHAGIKVPYTYQIKFHKGPWVWPALLQMFLLRPVRLLNGIMLTWALDISHAQVDR